MSNSYLLSVLFLYKKYDEQKLAFPRKKEGLLSIPEKKCFLGTLYTKFSYFIVSEAIDE
jgi:hypothetical protein